MLCVPLTHGRECLCVYVFHLPTAEGVCVFVCSTYPRQRVFVCLCVPLTHGRECFRQSSQQMRYKGHPSSSSTTLAASGSAWKLNSALGVMFPLPGNNIMVKCNRLYANKTFY